ncbi:MAG TPA: MBL fold metallo-hydrolase [Methanomassiliicoccales archaeon]|nr:MBL fold metallo-hydrolase [Methanomassiliicoccales archaeon]
MPVHAIPGLGHDSNIFLISGSRPILVDAGTGMHGRKVMERLQPLLRGTLDRLVLTHRHFDHVGGAYDINERFHPDILMHELDAASLEQGDDKTSAAVMFGCELRPMQTKHLLGGEVLDTGEHRFEVIHTPGHTIGSICLFEGRTKILISGDTVFAEGVGRWDLPTGDHEALLGSVKKLLSLNPKDIYPGHGACSIGNASDSINEALQILGEY